MAHGSPSAHACLQPGPIARLTEPALGLEASRGVLGLFSGPQFPHLSGRGLGAPTNCLHLPGVQPRVLHLLSPMLACAEGLSHLCPPLPCEVRLMGLSNRRV